MQNFSYLQMILQDHLFTQNSEDSFCGDSIQLLETYTTQRITSADSLQTLWNHIPNSENTGYYSSLKFSEFFKPLPTPPKSHQDNQQKGNLLLVDLCFFSNKKKVLNKWRALPCSWMERLSSVTMSVLLKLIDRPVSPNS